MGEDGLVWNHESPKDKQTKWILFIICPFVAFLYSLFSLKKKTSYYIIFLFFIIYGFCFTVGNERVEGSIDAISVRESFEEMVQTTPSSFYSSVKDYFSFDITSYKDIFEPTVMFIISRLTGNYHILFMVYAALFGFITLKCLRYLTLDQSYKNTAICLLLLIFFTTNQIFNINGFRFYFAAWIAVLCALKILRDGEMKYWAVLMITPLVHISFFFFVPVFILCFVTKSFLKIWFVLFLISSLLASVLQSFLDYSFNLPPILSFMFDSYLSKDAVASYNNMISTAAWYTRLLQFLSQIYPSILLVFIYFNKKLIGKANDYSLFLFCMALITVVNIVSPLSSMRRFMIICYPIIAYLWINCFKAKKNNTIILLLPIFMFLPYYQLLGNYIYFAPREVLYTNPLFLLIKNLL